MNQEKFAKILILPEAKTARRQTLLNAFSYASGLMLVVLVLLILFFPKFFLLLASGGFAKFFAARSVAALFFWKTSWALASMFFLAAGSYFALVLIHLKQKAIGVALDGEGVTSYFGERRQFVAWKNFTKIKLTTNPWLRNFGDRKKLPVFDVFDKEKLQQRIELYQKENGIETQTVKNMRTVAAALIEKEGKFLIAKRKAGGNAGGKWEFPGGKLEKGEKPQQCLARELKEELNIEAQVKNFFMETFAEYEHGSFKILVYEVDGFKGELKLNEHDEMAWVLPEEMPNFDFIQGDLPVIEKILKKIT